MPIDFVNINGQPITLAQMHQTALGQRKPKVIPIKQAKNKGFRVLGRPPGALEAAREAHQKVCRMAEKSGGKEIAPWNEAQWLKKIKLKPVNPKPLAIRSSAQQLVHLAIKAGWTEVTIVELISEPA